jgi:pantothenate kinase-related protein Tda10
MTPNWKEKITFYVGKSEHPLVVVLGPTASGKTAFSIAVAKFLESCGRRAEVVPLHEYWNSENYS